MTAQPDTTELRTLAEAATPGPWHVSAGIKQLEVVSNEDDLIYRRVRDQQAVPDAAFIAAANPTTILALLDRLDAAETKVAAVEFLAGRWERESAERGPNDRVNTAGVAHMIHHALDNPTAPAYRAALGETANQPSPDSRIAGRCCQYPKVGKCDRCGK